MPIYTVRDNQSGKTIKFKWNGEQPPTESDMEDVFRSAGGDTIAEPAPPSEQEPLGVKEMGKQALENFPESASNYLKTMVQPIIHPVETAKAIGSLGKGVAYKFKPGYQPEEDIPDRVWNQVIKEYGGIENVKRTFAEDPVQVTGDLASLLMGVGFVTKVGKLGKLSKVASVTGEVLEPTGVLLKPLKAAIAATDVKAPGNLGQRISERLYASSLKPSTSLPLEKRKEILETGITNKIVPTEQGLLKIRQDIYKVNQQINKMIDASAKKGEVLDTDKIVARLDDLREYYKNTIDPEEALKGINTLEESFKNWHGQTISVEKAQQIKKNTYHELRNAYGEMKNFSKEGQKTIARGIKEELETIFPEIKALNEKDGKLIQFEDALEKSIARIANRDVFGIGGGLTPIKIVVDSPMLKSRLAFIVSKARRELLRNPTAAAKLGLYQAGRVEQSPKSRTLVRPPTQQ